MSDEQPTETRQPELAVLRAEMTAGFETTRRHFDVVAESLRADLKVVIEKTEATGANVDRLIATNAVQHAAFISAITDHDARIGRLETPPAGRVHRSPHETEGL